MSEESGVSEGGALWPPCWAFVDGKPSSTGDYRQRPEDFQVEERLDFEPEGHGEHLWLWIEKRRLTTPDLARQLARLADVAVRDVGFSGLKDRDAVTRQWFSLALPGRELAAGWDTALAERGARVLAVVRHPRKLKRGVHRANRFRLRIAGETVDHDDAWTRWQRIITEGVPNYFGPQRFGPDGRNLQRARQLLVRGWRKRQDPQGLLLSTARSYLFNMLLSERVADGTWHMPLDGDVVNLEGTASRFAVTMVDAELLARAEAGDLHPTGPLWGGGKLETSSDVAMLEARVAANYPALSGGLEAAGARLQRRALRMNVTEATWEREADAVWLGFTLPRGAFATAVLRELFRHPSLT